jgi:putative ABC transport system permease protein
VSTLLQDLRYCARSLRRSPVFAWISVVTIALGIAGATCVFAVADAVVLNTLPYPGKDNLVMLHWLTPSLQPTIDVNAPAYILVKNHARSFTSVSALYPFENGVNVSGIGSPSYAKALRVSASFFRTLGVAPLLGRDFNSEDDMPAGRRVAVISYRLWGRLFARNSQALGFSLEINNEKYTVIGIMPSDFRSFPEAELWIPLQLSAESSDPGNNYRVIARLRPGIDRNHAGSELKLLSAEYQALYPSAIGTRAATLILENLDQFIIGNLRQRLAILVGAVGFLLLITCANLAGLIVVRALARNRELAVRIALGSSRARLFRVFFIESAIVVCLGGVAGTLVAKETLPIVLALAPATLPSAERIHISGEVLLAVLVILALASIFFGVIPIIRVFRLDLNETLRQSSLTATAGPRLSVTAKLLVAIQSAMTLVLLFGAAVFLETWFRLGNIPPGFDSNHVTVAELSLASKRYQTTQSTWRLVDQVLQRLTASPNVEVAASVNGLPLQKTLNLPVRITDAGAPLIHAAQYHIVSRGYFRALQIQVVQGSSFEGADRSSVEPVAIINESLARMWCPHQSCIGKSIRAGEELGPELTDQLRQIVGVVSDIREEGVDRPAPPAIFIPASQAPDGVTAFTNKLFLVDIAVRTRDGAADISDTIRSAIASVDPELPVASTLPLRELLTQSLAYPRFYSIIVSTFGGFALLLTSIGLYGLLSYQTSLRVPELGIRMAVGARRSEIVWLIVRQGFVLNSLGVPAGIGGIILLSHVITVMLYNVKVSTLGIVLSVVFLIEVVSIFTSLLVAFEAASIEPMLALRNE